MKLIRITNEIAETTSGITSNTSVRRHKKLTKVTQQRVTGQSAPVSRSRLFDRGAIVAFLQRVFLPKGYPDSVTPDYLRYQIYNALQAFCNSLAGLLASRALLEGYGIGDPSASATNALLLNIFLDVFSRTTTIISAHHLGSSLVPDAKKYRLLADILNDSALAFDTLSPLFNAIGLPQLRVAVLCLSASFRALCGIVAGGSKAAISLHFASPLQGKGDIGDLNAKDSSKETVLALIGMLLGSLIVPQLTTAFSTYFTLFVLVTLHIVINYIGVRGLVLRTMNHQRLWISWFLYESDKDFSPDIVNSLERLFPFSKITLELPLLPKITFVNPFSMDTLTTFRNPLTQEVLGYVTLGSSFAHVLEKPLHPEVIAHFQHIEFILWFDKSCLVYPDALEGSADDEEPNSPIVVGTPHIHVCYRDRCSPASRVQAWIGAGLLCKSIQAIQASDPNVQIEACEVFTSYLSESTYKAEGAMSISSVVKSLLLPLDNYRPVGVRTRHDFKRAAEKLGWVYDGGFGNVVMPEPRTLVTSLGYSYEAKKDT